MDTMRVKSRQKLKVESEDCPPQFQVATADARHLEPEEVSVIAQHPDRSPLSSSSVPSLYRRPAARPWWVPIGALLVAWSAVYGAANLSQLGMDWGYFSIDNWIGQPQDNNQWMGAGWLQILAAPSIYLAMGMSVLKGALGGSWRWKFLIPIVPVVAYALAEANFNAVEFWDRLPDSAPYMLGVWLASIALSLAFDRLYKELAKRVNATRLLSAVLIAALPAALLPINQSGLAKSHELMPEISLYCALLFAAAFYTPYAIKNHKQGAAFSAQFFGLFPVLVFNLTNIAFATVCAVAGKQLGLDIDWHALASASLIFAVSFAATTAGAACGALTRQMTRAIRSYS